MKQNSNFSFKSIQMKKFRIKWVEKSFAPGNEGSFYQEKEVEESSEDKVRQWFISMKELSQWEDGTICNLVSINEI